MIGAEPVLGARALEAIDGVDLYRIVGSDQGCENREEQDDEHEGEADGRDLALGEGAQKGGEPVQPSFTRGSR